MSDEVADPVPAAEVAASSSSLKLESPPSLEDGVPAVQEDPQFLCQRCCQALKLDGSFKNPDQLLLDVLGFYDNPGEGAGVDVNKQRLQSTSAIFSQPEPSSAVTHPQISSVALKARMAEALRDFSAPERFFRDTRFDNGLGPTSGGFTILGVPNGATTSPAGVEHHLSREMHTTAFMFDFVNGRTDVDHPLCEECTDSLLDTMDQQLKVIQNECRDYTDYLERVKSDDADEAGDEKELTEEEMEERMRALDAEEEALMKELADLEIEKKELAAEQAEREKEVAELEEEEKKYFRDYAEYKRQALEMEDEQRSIDNHLKYARLQVDKLKKTNVFNGTFHIWHDGHFGTINGFRLGRLPSIDVDWSEINAAWGQTVLLLHSLANKMGLSFQRFRLVPFGNTSHVEGLEDGRQLPLYGTGGFRFFWDTKFDQAMVAFLDCLQQFKEEVEKGDNGFCLPYRMDKGKIEDPSSGNSYSVKIQFNSEEQWTKALKFMLTNLKWGLAWVSSQFANKS